MNQMHSLKDFKELVSRELISAEQLSIKSGWDDNVGIFVKLAVLAGFHVDDLVEIMETRGKSQMIETVFEKLLIFQKYASGEPIFRTEAQ